MGVGVAINIAIAIANATIFVNNFGVGVDGAIVVIVHYDLHYSN